MDKITSLVEQQKIEPLIHTQRFSFEEVGQAHQCWESGRAIGKIVLKARGKISEGYDTRKGCIFELPPSK